MHSNKSGFQIVFNMGFNEDCFTESMRLLSNPAQAVKVLLKGTISAANSSVFQQSSRPTVAPARESMPAPLRLFGQSDSSSDAAKARDLRRFL